MHLLFFSLFVYFNEPSSRRGFRIKDNENFTKSQEIKRSCKGNALHNLTTYTESININLLCILIAPSECKV